MLSAERLQTAACRGDVGVVRTLLSGSAGSVAGLINEKGRHGFASLHDASAKGHSDMARLLLEKGAAINAKGQDGLTPLHMASMQGYTDMVRLLLEKGADADAKAERGETALDLAKNDATREVFRQRVNTKQGITALHDASYNGYIEAARQLLEKGADVLVEDKDGMAALHYACAKGYAEVVRLLLEKGANAEAKNKRGETPLDYAMDDATREVLRQFSARVAKKNKNKLRKKKKSKAAADANSDSDAPDEGPDDVKESGSSSAPLPAPGSALPLPLTVVSSSSATTAASAPLRPPLFPQNMSLVQKLYHAAADGDIRAVRTLLSGSGGSVARLVNGIGRTGYTALLAATQLGHPDIVRVLLAKGADIDAKGKHGFAALYVASRRSHRATDMVRLLLEKGADIEVKDKEQSTPLHGASQEGNLDVVRLLLEKGAVAGAKDKAERTALHGASGEGHLEVVRLLLEKGVDVGAKDKTERLALHFASHEGHEHVVRLLLEKGANAEAKDKNGQTSLDAAKDDATREVFRQFSTRVAKKNKKKQAKKGKSKTADADTGAAVLVQLIQRVFRGRRVRRGLDLGALRWTRDERQGRRAFDSKWGGVVEGVGRARGGRKGEGRGSGGAELGEFRWEDEKAKYDMVLDRGSIEGEGGGVGGEGEMVAERDIRALQKIMGDVALTPAPPSAAGEEDSEEEEEQGQEQGMEQGQRQGQGGAIIYDIEVTQDVVSWRKDADAALLIMFDSRVQMLAGGHRSYAYSKRLVGTGLPRGVHLRETKLNKGMRILWTQLRRGVEKPAILIWFVAKHDGVSHCLRQVDRSFRHKNWAQGQTQIQTHIQIKGQGQGEEAGVDGGEGEVVELGEDESLLDPVGNAPLKTYTLISCSDSGGGDRRGEKLPLRLSKREREVNLAVGTVLLLGRSGTGKTICLCNRMTSDRQANPVSSQLFVCRNHRLRFYVEKYQREHGNLEEDSGGNKGKGGNGGGGCEGVQSRSPESAFLTVDSFLRDMESRVLGAADTDASAGADTDAGTGTTVVAGRGSSGRGSSGRGRVRFLPSKRVQFQDFQQLFPSFGRPKLDPLVAWTQIRSFIKGSVEALLGEGADGSSTSNTSNSSNSSSSSSGSRALSLRAYLDLSKKRCRLQPPEREEAYAVYLQYEAALRSKGLWDDCDRVMRILLTAGLHLPLGKSGGDGGGDGGGFGQVFDKVYVDEVQDSSQIEIALYFLAAGMRYDRLFLAGDPAQAIVEGIDFRFEEVRGIVYALSQQTVNISSPVTLNTNYRCHRRILNCASGVLDLLLSTFPHAADKLPRDEGLCGGPRPEYLPDTGAGAGTGTGAGAGAYLRQLLLDNPLFVVLCRDEQFLSEGEGGDQGGQGGQVERLGPELRRFVPELTLALGIRESKGMEFPNVLLLNFFCDMPENQQRAWKLLLIHKHTHDAQPQMETQLKLLYTAITRSCARLIFAETRSSAAGDAFFRWLEGEKLAERMAQREGAGQAEGEGQGEGIYRSNDEWRALGIQLAMSNGGIPALRIAAEYFQRAGDKAQNLLGRVLLQEQVERAREGFSSALGDAETLTPAHEVELAALVLRCVELQLYQDALDLGSLLLPHLPAQSQALMREKVLGELRVFTLG